MSDESILSLRRFGVSFGDQVVLASVSLELPRAGMVSLIGSAGAGKSTLVRTLAGLNDAQPALQTWGEALFAGAPLSERRPALVHQHARLLTATVRENLVSALPDRSAKTMPEQTDTVLATLHELRVDHLAEHMGDSVLERPLLEQRALAIVRAALTASPLLLIDEPTSGLDDAGSLAITELLARLVERRAVLLVTHDRRVIHRIGGHVALLAGGRIVEWRDAHSFFDDPHSEPARAFVHSGRCATPGPMAKPEDLRPSCPAPPPLPQEARAAVSRSVGPRGFYWLLPGILGGLPRPGIVNTLDQDLAGLGRLGVTRLVTLEEDETVPRDALERQGIATRHFPIVDMYAPELAATAAFCADVDAWAREGEVIALHCRAGHGRTGTLLTAQLIWRGATALDALERARAIHPKWVQSDEQVSFLAQFERWLIAHPPGIAAKPQQ